MGEVMAKGKYEYWLTNDGLLLLAAWARDGLTDEQIAKNCGISRSTLALWKDKYSDISDALKKNKEIADIEVENALFKRATGYTHNIVKPFAYKGEIIIAEFVEEVAPDVTAQIFWLKNRKPAEWRDKPDEHNISDEREDDNLWNAIAEAVKKDEV